MTGLPKQCDGKYEELKINDHYTKVYVDCLGADDKSGESIFFNSLSTNRCPSAKEERSRF